MNDHNLCIGFSMVQLSVLAELLLQMLLKPIIFGTFIMMEALSFMVTPLVTSHVTHLSVLSATCTNMFLFPSGS